MIQKMTREHLAPYLQAKDPYIRVLASGAKKVGTFKIEDSEFVRVGDEEIISIIHVRCYWVAHDEPDKVGTEEELTLKPVIARKWKALYFTCDNGDEIKFSTCMYDCYRVQQERHRLSKSATPSSPKHKLQVQT